MTTNPNISHFIQLQKKVIKMKFSVKTVQLQFISTFQLKKIYLINGLHCEIECHELTDWP